MKKMLAVLFVCGFMFAMFSGCSESPTEPKEDPAPTATPVPAAPTPTSTPTFTPPIVTLKYKIIGTSQAMMVAYADAWGNTIYVEGLVDVTLAWEKELQVGQATTAVGAGGLITDDGNAQVYIYKDGNEVGHSPVFTQPDCMPEGYSYIIENF